MEKRDLCGHKRYSLQKAGALIVRLVDRIRTESEVWVEVLGKRTTIYYHLMLLAQETCPTNSKEMELGQTPEGGNALQGMCIGAVRR